jgi:putative hydrolase of the HAD superfamily
LLKALTCDFWNTLVREKEFETTGRVVVERLTRILRAHGQERTPAQVEAAVSACRELVMAGQVQEGREMPPEEQLPWIFRQLEVKETPGLFRAAYEAYTTASLEEMPEPVPGITAVLPKLVGRLKLAVICNTGRTPGRTARIILERLGLAKYFSHLTFSNEVGVAKPHPEIFRHALGALGLEATEVAHIGDDPRTDVKGARAAGMYALWFNPTGRPDKVCCDLEIRRWEDILPWVDEQVGRG